MRGSCDNGFIFIGRNARWSDFEPRFFFLLTFVPNVGLFIEIHKIHDVGVT